MRTRPRWRAVTVWPGETSLLGFTTAPSTRTLPLEHALLADDRVLYTRTDHNQTSTRTPEAMAPLHQRAKPAANTSEQSPLRTPASKARCEHQRAKPAANTSEQSPLPMARTEGVSELRAGCFDALGLAAMSRRLEVELTSKRDDGSYTWRQAGAKQPKGVLDGALLYEGAAIGDVVRVDADFAVDGVFITHVLPPKAKRVEKPTLEILGSGKDVGGVTTQLVGKRGRSGDRDGRGGGRGRGGDRNRKDGRGDRDGRGRGRGGDRNGRGDRNSRNDSNRDGRGRGRGGSDKGRGRGGDTRPRRDNSQSRPKPKRLRSRRVHRDALLNSLPEMQRPLARVVLKDGVPGLRTMVEAQNKQAAAKGELEIPPKILEAVGENLLPRLRSAEWRDNADAALEGIAEVDLRDIRKVVVAADNGAKDDESRALAQQLKDGLAARVEAEHGKWLSDLDSLLKDGRTVRALRDSSRPPKAGAPLPKEMAARLAEAAGKSMDADTMAERWGTVLDAVAYSPVRQQVNPVALPKKITPQLQATVKKLSKRVPHIAALFAPAKAATPPAQAKPQVPPPPAVPTPGSAAATPAPPVVTPAPTPAVPNEPVVEAAPAPVVSAAAVTAATTAATAVASEEE